MYKENKESAIASFLEDLTHLQIDTIVKSGMTAIEPPERVEELLFSLHCKYINNLKGLIGKVVDDNGLEYPRNSKIYTLQDLETELEKFQDFMDEHNVRMDESSYIIYQRMLAFCLYMKNKNRHYKIVNQPQKQIYTINLNTYHEFNLEPINAKDLSKLKRFHDLGIEKVVMQTRIGIDGDVISRIEEGFANAPKQLLVNIHDDHTRLTMQYWNSLIDTVVSIVGKIVSFKNKS